MARFVITGTGTDIGKTVLAAGLCSLTGASYWKPIQTGTDDPATGNDSHTVTALSHARVWPEAYRLPAPLSPHRAAELADVVIAPDRLVPPDGDVMIEGAGGVLVPVTRDLLSADLFARWGLPVILACGTGLGTISHSLTAIEALRARGCLLHGIAFIGPDNPDNIATIAELSGARVLGRLPRLDPLDAPSLATAMHAHFNPEDYA